MSKKEFTRREFLKILGVAAAGAVLGGCGAEPEEGSPTGEETPPKPTPTSTATPKPTEIPTSTPELTKTIEPHYFEQRGFEILENSDNHLILKRDDLTLNFDTLANTGGLEIPRETDPEVFYNNLTRRFELEGPVQIALKLDSKVSRYFYRLEEGQLADTLVTDEEGNPLEYPAGSYLFPFPNDIVPAEVFARADVVAWSRSGANTLEQLKLEIVSGSNEEEPLYQLKVIAQAGPPDWSWVEPEKEIVYPATQGEIEELGLEVGGVRQEKIISSEEDLDRYVQDISAEIGRDLFLVPMSGEALADFPGQAWALIDYKKNNKIGNIYFDPESKQALIRFYDQTGREFNQPLSRLRINNGEFSIEVDGIEYSNPQGLFWEKEGEEAIDLPETVELSQLPPEIYANIQEFLEGKEYPEDNKVVYESYLGLGSETVTGLLQLWHKFALAQGIYLGITTPEQTEQLFNVHNYKTYLVWMGHTIREGKRAVLPYAIPREQFARLVAIRTSADSNRHFVASLKNNARKLYDKSQQDEFMKALESYIGQYIYLNLYLSKLEYLPEFYSANLATALALELPYEPDGFPSEPAALNFGLNHYQLIEQKLEKLGPIELPLITKPEETLPTDIKPPLLFSIYVFAPKK